MVTLGPQLLINKGKRRACYHHPDDDRLCIKIVVSGDNKETSREQAYYRLLERRRASWEMIARFYGNVDTNMGAGAVFELIRDYDNKVSQTLKYYLSSFGQNGIDYNQIFNALNALKKFLLRERVVTMSLADHNIIFKKISETEGVLVLVDNIGNSDFIPVASYFHFFAKKKILREWRRFESCLFRDYAFSGFKQNYLRAIHKNRMNGVAEESLHAGHEKCRGSVFDKSKAN